VNLIRLMISLAGFGLLSTGCYTLEPVTVAAPAPGTRLALTINDVGRVALGGSMGPALLRVNGSLQAKDSDEYVLSVSGVDLLQGGFQAWAGETVRINSSYVSAVSERTFSTGRTILATAATVGLVALVVSKGGLRSFLPGTDTEEPPGSETRRGRVPARPGLPPFLRSINPPRSH
jgi:hypothetical protein